MRKVAFIFFLLTINIGISYAQIAGKRYQEPLNNKSLTQDAVKKELFEHNFSNLFTLTDNSMVYGFIGDDFMRIRIKIISVTKDTTSPETYNIYGKSMVKGNIADFNGKIKISKILKLNITQHGCEDGYKFKGFKGQFSLFGVYLFAENKNQNNSGIFKGVFRSDYFVDKNNKVKYDDIENCSDDFTNNQFVGTWTSYKNNISKKCNWGIIEYQIQVILI